MRSKLLAPAIRQYEFPATLSKDLINLFESGEGINWSRSLVGSGHENEIRTSKQFNFEVEMPIAASKVKEIFVNCVNLYIEEFDVKITQDEGLSLLKYESDNKYDYHSDGEWTIYRSTSALIYLNPQDYEGGETHFKWFDLYVKPEEPSIVIFPSNYAYIHAAMPVTSGVKYIFVTWMNDMPHGFSPNILRNIAGSIGALGGHNH